MPQAFYILFGPVFTVAAAVIAGRLLLRRWELPLYRQEEPAFSFLIGAALLSLALFGLAAAHLLYKGVFLVAGALVVWRGWKRPPDLPDLPVLPLRRIWWALPPVAVFSVLYFFHAMAPEMSPDGSAYHLALVAKYYREHGFSAITTNMYANLSQAVDLLFLVPFAFGRHSAAALLHLAFLPVLCWLMLCYGRRFGFATPALIGALFVFFSPVVGIDAASAYIDVAVTSILFGLYSLTQIWDQTRARALLVAMGVLCGFAIGAKYTAFTGAVYAAAFLGWRKQWKQIGLVAAVAAVWVSPWLVKNALVLGNPVSPFGNRIFKNPYIHVAFEEEYAQRMREYELADRRLIPLELTVRGQALGGLLGPLFLLAPVALFSVRSTHGSRLLLAAALFG